MNTLIKIKKPSHQSQINKHFELGSDFNNRYLTKRETEILSYVTLGHTAKKIGKLLNISHRTVEAYVDILKSKLNCASKYEIIGAVLKSDIINKLHIL